MPHRNTQSVERHSSYRYSRTRRDEDGSIPSELFGNIWFFISVLTLLPPRSVTASGVFPLLLHGDKYSRGRSRGGGATQFPSILHENGSCADTHTSQCIAARSGLAEGNVAEGDAALSGATEDQTGTRHYFPADG